MTPEQYLTRLVLGAVGAGAGYYAFGFLSAAWDDFARWRFPRSSEIWLYRAPDPVSHWILGPRTGLWLCEGVLPKGDFDQFRAAAAAITPIDGARYLFRHGMLRRID